MEATNMKLKDHKYNFGEAQKSTVVISALITYVMVNIQMCKIEAENPLQHIDWEADMTSMQKHWFAYVRKIMESLLQKLNVKIIRLHSWLFQMSRNSLDFQYFMFIKYKLPCLHKKSEHVLKPIIEMDYNPTFCTVHYTNTILMHTYEFLPDRHFRWNITFIYFNLIDVFGWCSINNMTVTQKFVQGVIVYCNLHSKLYFYTASSAIAFNVNIRQRMNAIFRVKFSVISKDVLSNEIVNTELKVKPHSIHAIGKSRLKIYTYKIQVAKYERLVINLTSFNDTYYIYFDGPGFMSKKTVLFYSNGTVKLSSFQCVMQVVQRSLYIYNVPKYITYKGRSFIMSQYVILNRQTQVFTLPGKLCLEDICILRLRSSGNSILNVTITNHTYTGQLESKCGYGGTSFFEYSDITVTNMFTLCGPFWFPERSIYSHTSSVVVVVYSYQNYSSVQINFKISTSNCTLIKLSPCQPRMKFEELLMTKLLKTDPTSCSVVQISSGKFEFNEEINQSLAETISAGKNGYPLCPSLSLTLDQSQYMDMSTSYVINGFLARTYWSYSWFTIQNYQANNFIGSSTVTMWNHFGKTRKIQSSKLNNLLNQWYSGNNDMSLDIEFNVRRDSIVFEFVLNHIGTFWLNFIIKQSQHEFKRQIQYETVRGINFVNQVKTGAILSTGSSATFTVPLFSIPNIYHSDTTHKALVLLFSEPFNTITNLVVLQIRATKLKTIKHILPQRYERFSPESAYWIWLRYFRSFPQNQISIYAAQGTYYWMDIDAYIRLPTAKIPENLKRPVLYSYWIKGFQFPTHQTVIKTTRKAGIMEFNIERGKYSFIKQFRDERTPVKFSWKEAYRYCQNINRSLPSIYSRDDHKEFISLLKTSSDVFTIPAMYINLNSTSSQRYVYLKLFEHTISI